MHITALSRDSRPHFARGRRFTDLYRYMRKSPRRGPPAEKRSLRARQFLPDSPRASYNEGRTRVCTSTLQRASHGSSGRRLARGLDRRPQSLATRGIVMDESMPTTPVDRPLRPSERVDEACDRFEAAWQAGHGKGSPSRITTFALSVAEPLYLQQGRTRERGQRLEEQEVSPPNRSTAETPMPRSSQLPKTGQSRRECW